MLRRSLFIWLTMARSFEFENLGMAMAARMPMITTTISSSMSVKPRSPLFRIFIVCRMATGIYVECVSEPGVERVQREAGSEMGGGNRAPRIGGQVRGREVPG